MSSTPLLSIWSNGVRCQHPSCTPSHTHLRSVYPTSGRGRGSGRPHLWKGGGGIQYNHGQLHAQRKTDSFNTIITHFFMCICIWYVIQGSPVETNVSSLFFKGVLLHEKIWKQPQVVNNEYVTQLYHNRNTIILQLMSHRHYFITQNKRLFNVKCGLFDHVQQRFWIAVTSWEHSEWWTCASPHGWCWMKRQAVIIDSRGL